MADQQTPGISDADLESLAEKLDRFNQTLTPGEQAALAEVFERAMPQAEDDVQGFGRMAAQTAHTAETAKGRESARGRQQAQKLYTAQTLRFIVIGGHLGVR